MSGPTSILPKTPQTSGLNQQSLIRVTPTSKFTYYLKQYYNDYNENLFRSQKIEIQCTNFLLLSNCFNRIFLGTNSPVQVQQRVQILRGPDGKLQVRGLLPGQQLVQMPDGKLHVLNVSQTSTTIAQGAQTNSTTSTTTPQVIPLKNTFFKNNIPVCRTEYIKIRHILIDTIETSN